jgi:predicted nuclease with TOPRIM domain
MVKYVFLLYHLLFLLFSGFQKLERLESELSKALDLAKGYKEKVDSIEKEKLELIEHHKSEIRNLMDRIKEGEQKLENANQLNCDSLEKVKQAEQEAQKVCKHYQIVVQWDVILNTSVTHIFMSSHPVHYSDL